MTHRLPPWSHLVTLGVFLLALGYLAWLGWGLLPGNQDQEDHGFNGERALSWARAQCEIGPRPSGSKEATLVGDMIIQRLEELAWETRVQQFDYQGIPLRNIVAMAGDTGPLMIIATHYDTRLRSDRDRDLDRRDDPTPGANDGASGVSVLLELARAVDQTRLAHRLWLVFLDGEANRGLPEWKTNVGAEQLTEAVLPDAFIYLNLVGGENARFPKSAPATELLQDHLWSEAKKIGLAGVFLDDIGPAVEGAHTVFLNKGVPSVAIVQSNYPYYRTTEDDCKYLSASTFQQVGTLLEFYLEERRFLNIAPTLK